jgi:hypothetical protein
MPDEALNVRLVTHVTASEMQRIDDYRFDNRIGGRAEAVRQLIALGLKAGVPVVDGDAAIEPLARVPSVAPPKIPTPDECGKPFLGEIVLPWLRSTGKDRVELGEVLQGAFGENLISFATGRDKAITTVFKAIGWKSSTSKEGGVSQRVFLAPPVAQ